MTKNMKAAKMPVSGLTGPLTTIAELAHLNLLTLLCCLPLITAGASLTAMHSVLVKMSRKEEGYIGRMFFDASLFHDEDGRKYLVSLEWETRENYEKPGFICLTEYDPHNKTLIGYPQMIWRGGTDRGCIEGPHIYRRDGWYYLMCAEGGTGYNHCVTMARSKNVFGPYEGDPENPIVTSVPGVSYERNDPDHLKPKYYNPDSILQKSGHGSWIETQKGEQYLVHLTSRPFVPELRCTLGRETAIQKMKWTQDGWLRMTDGGRLAAEYTEESSLPEHLFRKPSAKDDFDGKVLRAGYYTPRIYPESFTDLESRPGWLRMRGQEARTSLNEVSILARKLTSVRAVVTTKMDFQPEVFQQSAGLIFYYDNMNYVNLRKYYSETLGCAALSIVSVDNGKKDELLETRTEAPHGLVFMRLIIEGRRYHFEWSGDGETYHRIGEDFDTTKLSDEYSDYGEFTGAFVGITCADRLYHRKCADFDFFEYVADEDAPVS